MFTGIIEATGQVTGIDQNETNVSFTISSPISHELSIDQSISHDGVCLTVEAVHENTHRVTAIAETLDVTALNQWTVGTVVNLERCMRMNGRLDGHIVQGHVDTTATCLSITDRQGSWEYRFGVDKKFAAWMIEKGSVCVNGTSLTLFDVGLDAFTVAIIPYTYEHTNINRLETGQLVNVEFDVIGKYVHRIATVGSAG
jgi:riboflavin synthase